MNIIEENDKLYLIKKDKKEKHLVRLIDENIVKVYIDDNVFKFNLNDKNPNS